MSIHASPGAQPSPSSLPSSRAHQVAPNPPTPPPVVPGKLWTRVQFPEGCKGASNWDLCNLAAAQAWRCPCTERNCLSKDRYPKPDELYDYRKTFQTTSKGLRDTFRDKVLEPVYSSENGTFGGVRIGKLNDNCIAAAGLAAGLSFGTFANARADVTKSRPHHQGRAASRDKLASAERVHLNAYIRDLRSTMEGSKGSDTPKWHTGKRSGELRWGDYERDRRRKNLPVIGSKHLFVKIWAEHSEIVQDVAVGHAKCDACGRIQTRWDELEDRNDEHGRKEQRALEVEQAVHDEEHRGERKYSEDAWFQGETNPDRMTTIRLDAPTQHQFDLPRPRKIARDVVKSLDGAQRWSSKITGAQVAGAGMFAFVARAALGGGSNLVGTALLLTLGSLNARGITLGSRLQLILDNTTGENKCNAIIGLLAWLVHWNYFQVALCVLYSPPCSDLSSPLPSR